MYLQAFTLPFTLSTSQTPIQFYKAWPSHRPAVVGGFGTVTDDGYGVSYIVVSDDEGRLASSKDASFVFLTRNMLLASSFLAGGFFFCSELLHPQQAFLPHHRL